MAKYRTVMFTVSLLSGLLHAEVESETPIVLNIPSSPAVKVSFDNVLMWSVGFRVESPDPDMIGKVSLEQNRNLCAADDCIGLSRNDTAPNERFMAARGLLSSNTDDGNLNYDAGDPVLGFLKWDSRLSLGFENFDVEISWQYLFDAVNYGFEEFYSNQIVSPGTQPGQPTYRDRPEETEAAIGQFIDLRDAWVSFRMPIGEREADIKIGRQLLNWGESTFVLRGNLNFINPYETNNLFRPGFELEEIYRPVGLVNFDMAWSDRLRVQAFYQFEWLPYGLPAKGAVYSFLDAGNEVTHNESVVLPFAKTPNDPDQLQTPASPLLSLISGTSFSARRAPNREAKDGGQFGVGLRYFRDDWFDGTELAVFLANYHARIPSLSGYAADASCTRREGNGRGVDTSNIAEFLIDCGIPLLNTPGQDFEALPLDTFRYFLEYPEDIHLLGATFNIESSGILYGGEFAYRHNQPVQVDLEDIIFAGLQPAFPRHDILIIPGTLPGLPAATIPASQTALPDYVTSYRGGTAGEIAPNAYIRGYESEQTVQLTLTATKLFGNRSSFLGSKQFALLAEVQGIWVPGLPSLDQLQYEGPGTHTHASPGTADTGNGSLLNPIRNEGGYVSEFSWGYRLTAIGSFDLPIKGVEMRPLLVWLHDIEGVSPGFAENFLEGRQIGIFQVDFRRGPWTLGTTYNFFGGGGDRNAFRDRDFMSMYLRYKF